jgi:hypothetical protein
MVLPTAILVKVQSARGSCSRPVFTTSFTLEIRVFRDWFSRKDAPLTGAPAVRRIKHYSAEIGYAYEYRYEGQRPYGDAGVEYVFRFRGGPKEWRRTGVLVADACLGGRDTSSTERYAIAKLALLEAFDAAAPDQVPERVDVTASQAAAICERLGLT